MGWQLPAGGPGFPAAWAGAGRGWEGREDKWSGRGDGAELPGRHCRRALSGGRPASFLPSCRGRGSLRVGLDELFRAPAMRSPVSGPLVSSSGHCGPGVPRKPKP